MTTFTTIEQIEELMDSRDDIYVRWSHGPETDAANGWISKNYAGTWDDARGDYDYVPVDEVGLSATALDDVRAITRWANEVHGELCYILSAREIGLCGDEEPLVANCQPLGIVAPELIRAIRNA